MHVFIAGVMQANRRDKYIESQNYRLRLAEALQKHIPNVQITDPWALNPNSVHYDADQARHTFISMTKRASEVDVLLAYLPLPSMGTAMEMWEAYRAGVYIVAVTPFEHHWAIRFTSDELLSELDELIEDIENGRWQQWKKK